MIRVLAAVSRYWRGASPGALLRQWPLAVLAGVVIISLGYVSSLGSPLEGPLIGLINGPASPFRNLWKFDPLVRLPLAMGLAHLLAAPWRESIKESQPHLWQ